MVVRISAQLIISDRTGATAVSDVSRWIPGGFRGLMSTVVIDGQGSSGAQPKRFHPARTGTERPDLRSRFTITPDLAAHDAIPLDSFHSRVLSHAS